MFFCLTGFTSLPWPITHLVFPCPQSPKDTPPTSVTFLEGLSSEAYLTPSPFPLVSILISQDWRLFKISFYYCTFCGLSSSDDFSSISSFVFHMVGTPSPSNPAWGKVSVLPPSGNVEFVWLKALDSYNLIFLLDLWNYEDVWRDLDLASVILGPRSSPCNWPLMECADSKALFYWVASFWPSSLSYWVASFWPSPWVPFPVLGLTTSQKENMTQKKYIDLNTKSIISLPEKIITCPKNILQFITVHEAPLWKSQPCHVSALTIHVNN